MALNMYHVGVHKSEKALKLSCILVPCEENTFMMLELQMSESKCEFWRKATLNLFSSKKDVHAGI